MTIYKKITIDNKVLTIYHDSDCDSPMDEDCRPYDLYVASNRIRMSDDQIVGRPDEDEIDPKMIFPIYRYEHGGVAYSTSPFSCPWDSGKCGFAVFTEERMNEAGISKEADLAGILEREIETFSLWANGEVYGFCLEVDGVVEDSCFGFIGIDSLKENIPEEFRSELY